MASELEDAVSDEEDDEPPEERPSRNRKPPARFTYDTMGKPLIPRTAPPSQMSHQGQWTPTQPMNFAPGWTWVPQIQNFVWVPPANQFPSAYMHSQGPLPMM